MNLTGVSFGGDSAIRWIESGPADIECLEVAAEGLFSRPSPYLAWLASRFRLVVRASALSVGTQGPLSESRLQAVVEIASLPNCFSVVHPLGFSASDEVRLGSTVPIGHTEETLAVVAEHVLQAAGRCTRPALVEPVTASLRVPGTLTETAFLVELCRLARCRVLVDVTSLLIAGRNHGVDPWAWLGDLPPELIGAARISGCTYREGLWRHDPRGAVDEDAWTLMHSLVARRRPDVLILGVREREEDAGIARDLQRLRQLSGEPSNVMQAHATTGARAPTSFYDANSAFPVDPIAALEPAAEHVQVAAGVSMFVLDMEGVLFSESRHELSLLNTPATLVWCLVEQGLSVSEITRAYSGTFGLASSEGARHVGTILQQWFALGHISRPAVDVPSDVPLTTALTHLLTNRQLLQQFRQAPMETAAALKVRPGDAESFALLDPDELDDQAREIERSRFPWLDRASAEPNPPAVTEPEDTDAEADTTPAFRHPASSQVRYYRLLDTTFSVRLDSMDVADGIHQALAHLECPAASPDAVLDLRQAESGGWMNILGGAAGEFCRRSDEVVPAVKQWLRETAIERTPYPIRIHAGVVAFRRGCVLLPASAGSGKTTLTAALIRSGATYFSDEVAPLEQHTLAVRPVPLALTVKDGSVDILRPLYPEVASLRVHVREDFVRVRYLQPRAETLPRSGRARAVKWIVFPRYDPAVETTLCPLERPAALRRLLDEAAVDVERLDRVQAESLVMWMRTVDCYDLRMSSLETAVAAVRRLVR